MSTAFSIGNPPDGMKASSILVPLDNYEDAKDEACGILDALCSQLDIDPPVIWELLLIN